MLPVGAAGLMVLIAGEDPPPFMPAPPALRVRQLGGADQLAAIGLKASPNR